MNLRFVFGDQLSHGLSALEDATPNADIILMSEVMGEATSVKHHKKKIAFIFSAMRHFAKELEERGFQVLYTKLDDPENTQSFSGELERALSNQNVEHIIITQPSEYRVQQDVLTWAGIFGLPVDIRPDTRFLCPPQDFADWAEGRKELRMEYFYREMRKRYGVLMNGDQPIGGKWNYDNENRKPPKSGLDVPSPYMSQPDGITEDVITLIDQKFKDHFGDIRPFHLAVTRKDALVALDQFIKERLSQFGDFQDAMIEGEPWMFHSHISFYLNIGLLLPLECIEQAEAAYHAGHAPLNAVEGFIRQILGWREYVRGLYELKMPDYAKLNKLEATRPLPPLYWGAATKMNCLSQCIKETRENAYAHHIQRLMVLGNFALLAGLDPKEVNEWYLVVYADAFEWVELPNVSGMVLYADGGVLASKPYAASGAYINKMSNYCKGCSYKSSKKNGPEACPFNYLYWDFIIRHKERLKGNHRMGMMYKTLERMDSERIAAITSDAARFLKAMDHGETV